MVTPWHAIFANHLKGGRSTSEKQKTFFLSFCSQWSQCLSREDVTSSYCPHGYGQLVSTGNRCAPSRGLAHTCAREGTSCLHEVDAKHIQALAHSCHRALKCHTSCWFRWVSWRRYSLKQDKSIYTRVAYQSCRLSWLLPKIAILHLSLPASFALRN